MKALWPASCPILSVPAHSAEIAVLSLDDKVAQKATWLCFMIYIYEIKFYKTRNIPSENFSLFPYFSRHCTYSLLPTVKEKNV